MEPGSIRALQRLVRSRSPVLDHPEAHFAEILDRLKELGRQGWLVMSVDLSHPSYSAAAQPSTSLPVLFGREVLHAIYGRIVVA